MSIGWVALGLGVATVAAEGAVRLVRVGDDAFPTPGLRPETTDLSPDRRPKALVLGDSIPYGHMLPYAQSWPAVLERELGGRIAVVNAGIQGQTSVMALAEAPTLLRRFRPQIVLIAFGLNDGNLSRSCLDDERERRALTAGWLAALRCSRLLCGAEARIRRWRRARRGVDIESIANRPEPRVSPAAFRAALCGLVRLARRAGARRVLLLTCTPVAGALRACGEPFWSRLIESYGCYNRIIRDVAEGLAAERVDVAAEFKGGDELYQDDGVHLTAAGQARVAGIVREALERGAAGGR